jgi:predicted O-methyltransferase YrrM
MIDEQIPGFCPRPQLRAIEEISKNVPENGAIVEIGSLFGRSAFAWAASCKPSVKIFCIDPWDETEIEAYSGFSMSQGTHHGKIRNSIEVFKKNLGPYLPRVTTIQERSPLQNWTNGNVDVVYIDGNHTFEAVCSDITYWYKLLNKDGILCGDDFYDDHAEVVQAVVTMAQEFGCEIFRIGKFWAFRSEANSKTLKLAEEVFIRDCELPVGGLG